MKNELNKFTPGVLLSLLTLFFGFALGGVFGGAEDWLKGDLKSRGEAVLDTAYNGDLAAMAKVTDKSWVYYKRAHLHANGLGTSSLAMILVIAACSGVNHKWRWFTSLGLGIGSLGYSLFWLFAGLRAPGLGGTGAAKDSLEWLAVPNAGLLLLGVLSVIGIVIKSTKSE